MKKTTITQRLTLILIIAYMVWEYFVQRWAKTLPPSDPVIRADLIIIIPLLSVLIVVSLLQFFRDRKNNS